MPNFVRATVLIFFWAPSPFVTSFEFGPRTLSVFILLSLWVVSFSYLFRVYSLLFVIKCHVCVVSYRVIVHILFMSDVSLFIWLCFLITRVCLINCISYVSFFCFVVFRNLNVVLYFQFCFVFSYILCLIKLCFELI